MIRRFLGLDEHDFLAAVVAFALLQTEEDSSTRCSDKELCGDEPPQKKAKLDIMEGGSLEVPAEESKEEMILEREGEGGEGEAQSASVECVESSRTSNGEGKGEEMDGEVSEQSKVHKQEGDLSSEDRFSDGGGRKDEAGSEPVEAEAVDSMISEEDRKLDSEQDIVKVQL